MVKWNPEAEYQIDCLVADLMDVLARQRMTNRAYERIVNNLVAVAGIDCDEEQLRAGFEYAILNLEDNIKGGNA